MELYVQYTKRTKCGNKHDSIPFSQKQCIKLEEFYRECVYGLHFFMFCYMLSNSSWKSLLKVKPRIFPNVSRVLSPPPPLSLFLNFFFYRSIGFMQTMQWSCKLSLNLFWWLKQAWNKLRKSTKVVRNWIKVCRSFKCFYFVASSA